MNKHTSRDWIREFEIFLKSPGVNPPENISNSLFAIIRSDLSPSMNLVSAKLFALHAVAAVAVLSVCPQLGVGPLFGGHGLGHVFMYFGPLPCAALCGALLFSVSALLAAVFLTREELRAANRRRFLHISLLVAASFTALHLSGADADRLSYLFWISGAIFAGWVVLGIGASARIGGHLMARG